MINTLKLEQPEHVCSFTDGRSPHLRELSKNNCRSGSGEIKHHQSGQVFIATEMWYVVQLVCRQSCKYDLYSIS